jgi:hypothetical protein
MDTWNTGQGGHGRQAGSSGRQPEGVERSAAEGRAHGRLWRQFLEESMAWLRSIEFLRQENSHLKNRLAEVVDLSTDREFLAQAEHFQNQFIIKDEFLDELRQDVNGQERQLQGMARRRETCIEDPVRTVQRKLREQMAYLERDFTGLRHAFNVYLDGRF